MMVNQIDSKFDFAPETHQHQYPSHPRRETRRARPDDLITSLANSIENRRARQVVEWEHMRRQNIRVSA